MMEINEFARCVHDNAVVKGFHDSGRQLPEILMLITTEVAEAMEEWRDGRSETEIRYREDGKPEGIPVEITDVIIRCFDYLASKGVDIEQALTEKHAYNVGRPPLHGRVR